MAFPPTRPTMLTGSSGDTQPEHHGLAMTVTKREAVGVERRLLKAPRKEIRMLVWTPACFTNSTSGYGAINWTKLIN